MKNVNQAFLEYHDANDLGNRSKEELAEIRAAFVSGYNCLAPLVNDLRQMVESLEAPSIVELRPSEDIVHDYYERIVDKLMSQS